MVLVFGDADPDDWHCPGRIAGASRSLHLLAANWFVYFVRLGRDGVVPPMASQPRNLGRRGRAYDNSTNHTQLFSNFLLVGQ